MTFSKLSPLAIAALEHARSKLRRAPSRKRHIWTSAEEHTLIVRYPSAKVEVDMVKALGARNGSGFLQIGQESVK
jgi:hypothetical protein